MGVSHEFFRDTSFRPLTQQGSIIVEENDLMTAMMRLMGRAALQRTPWPLQFASYTVPFNLCSSTSSDIATLRFTNEGAEIRGRLSKFAQLLKLNFRNKCSY